MNKQERVKEYENTVALCNKGFYTINGNEIHIDGLDDYMVHGTRFYNKKIRTKCKRK